MKVLIVGLGSIARRHIQALRNITTDLTLFALRSQSTGAIATQEGVINLFNWAEVPEDLDFIIISNPTSAHLPTIKQSISYGVPLFIEKPPLMNLDGVDVLLEDIKTNNIKTYTAFNMRFHPVLIWLKSNLTRRKVLEVSAYCGSYLPDWRPNIDYKTSYSASNDMGGGVHLDLIHELDYINWLFGPPKKVFGVKDKVSELEIDSADYAHYHLVYRNMHATITLNYFRRKPKRSIEIVLEKDIWYADLLENQVKDENNNLLFKSSQDQQKMYDDQMDYFIRTMSRRGQFMNDLSQSVRTLAYALNFDEGDA